MSKVTGKTVYILGAGASVHTGAPLLRDFLVEARLLLNGKEELQHREKFESVFQFIDKLRGASYYIDFDLDNIEHIFSLAEMKKQVGDAEGESLYINLNYLIMETLSHTCFIRKGSLNKEDVFIPDDTYLKFADILKGLNDQRCNIISRTIPFEEDVIITFNYDAMLDYAMYANGLGVNYCLDKNRPNPKNEFKVLKLHGSSNWGECLKCKNDVIETINIIDDLTTVKSFGAGQSQRPVPLNVSKLLENRKCNNCNGPFQPVFIPPTWSKNIAKDALKHIWSTAVKELKTAFQVIVIGYSMPQTDTFFQYLLTLGLVSNPNLHRVVIANRDISENLVSRYKNIFSRSLYDRGRLIFLRNKEEPTPKDFVQIIKNAIKKPDEGATFKSFVQKDMKRIGGDIDLDKDLD